MVEHCLGCVSAKAQRAHKASLRRWVIDERRRIHARYTAALAVFDTVYAVPHKYSLTSAKAALIESGNI